MITSPTYFATFNSSSTFIPSPGLPCAARAFLLWALPDTALNFPALYVDRSIRLRTRLFGVEYITCRSKCPSGRMREQKSPAVCCSLALLNSGERASDGQRTITSMVRGLIYLAGRNVSAHTRFVGLPRALKTSMPVSFSKCPITEKLISPLQGTERFQPIS